MSFSKEFRTFMKTLASVSGAVYEEHGMDMLELEYTHTDNPEAPTTVYMKIDRNNKYRLKGLKHTESYDTENQLEVGLCRILKDEARMNPPNPERLDSFFENPRPFIMLAQPCFSREFKHDLRLHVANVLGAKLKGFGDQRIVLTRNNDIYELKCTGKSNYTVSTNGDDIEKINNEKELMQRAQTLIPTDIENIDDPKLSDTIRTFAKDLCRITNGHLGQQDTSIIELELESDKRITISYESRDSNLIKVVFRERSKEYESEEAAEQSIKKYLVFNYPDYLDAVVEYCNDPEAHPALYPKVDPQMITDNEEPYNEDDRQDDDPSRFPTADPYGLTYTEAPPPPGPDLEKFQTDLHDLVNRVFDAMLARIRRGEVADATIDIQKQAMRTVVESLKTGYIGFTDTLTNLLQTLNGVVDSMQSVENAQ